MLGAYRCARIMRRIVIVNRQNFSMAMFLDDRPVQHIDRKPILPNSTVTLPYHDPDTFGRPACHGNKPIADSFNVAPSRLEELEIKRPENLRRREI